MKLHHFYHVYADGQWLEPVSEHIGALKSSGLYEALATLSIGFVGTPDNIRQAHQYIQSQGICYTIAAEQLTGWENITQQPMHDFAQNNDGLILYAHSKGAANTHDVNTRWRRSMIWHTVCRWKKAVEQLETHKTYGCHWIQPLVSMPEHRAGNWMYAGNFYWIHAALLRTWMRVPTTHRFESEGWIGYKYAEEPWPVYDCTPYFPNTNEFMDGWINNPSYDPIDKGKSYPPMPTIHEL